MNNMMVLRTADETSVLYAMRVLTVVIRFGMPCTWHFWVSGQLSPC